MKTFKALFWKARTGQKHFEIVTADDRSDALSIATAIFKEQEFEANGYLFAEFNEVFGTRHASPTCFRDRHDA